MNCLLPNAAQRSTAQRTADNKMESTAAFISKECCVNIELYCTFYSTEVMAAVLDDE